MKTPNFRPAGRSDVFSDGTPIGGRPLDVDSLSKVELLQLQNDILGSLKDATSVHFNPTAGSIRAKECTSPWMTDTNHKMTMENEKAQNEQVEKRVLGLARQTCEGLEHSLGISYGVAELSTQLRNGQLQRMRESNGEIIEKKDVVAASLLVAAEQYDLKRVADTLGVKPKEKSNYF